MVVVRLQTMVRGRGSFILRDRTNNSVSSVPRGKNKWPA